MILTVVKISLLRLWHSKSELLLTFVVPVIFFSIFALIFGSRERSGNASSVKITIVDQVGTESSRAIIDWVCKQEALRFFGESSKEVSRDDFEAVPATVASRMVQHGDVSTAIVLKAKPEQAKDSKESTTIAESNFSATVLTDSSDQIASKIVIALVQQAMIHCQIEDAKRAQSKLSQQTVPPNPAVSSATALSNVPGEQVRSAVELASARNLDGAAAEKKSPAAMPGVSANISDKPNVSDAPTQPANAPVQPANAIESVVLSQPVLPSFSLPSIEVTDVVGGKKKNPIVAMYAAGIAVMFLLFSVTGGGGSLLEEKENSTLERLLASQLTMDQLLMGKWLYLTLLGFVQITVMFLWGQFVFGVELTQHLDGFILMTLVTAGAASSFALLLATLCGSRSQLNWISIVLVLGMSALGGSMVPRYLMSERIQELGLFTFNAWALDGYNKVFWRDLPVEELWPQLAVLTLCGLAFIVAARLGARRWERI
jgi:ABC-2 type transport system permease protein